MNPVTLDLQLNSVFPVLNNVDKGEVLKKDTKAEAGN